MDGDREACRVAAASLLDDSGPKSLARAQQILQAALQTEKDPARLKAVDLALLQVAARQKNWSLLETQARKVLEVSPDSMGALSRLTLALTMQQRGAEAVALLDKQLQKRPSDRALRELAISLAVARKDTPGVYAAAREYESVGGERPSAYNSISWYLHVVGEGGEKTVRFARLAVPPRENPNPSAMHTLAAVLAREGQVQEALEVLNKRLERVPGRAADGADWYVLGLVAEAVGEKDVARELYKRVEDEPDEELPWTTCYYLAQQRLTDMARK
jgi:tetratricopeptide (TPR) repeat protein